MLCMAKEKIPKNLEDRGLGKIMKNSGSLGINITKIGRIQNLENRNLDIPKFIAYRERKPRDKNPEFRWRVFRDFKSPLFKE